MTNQYGFFRKAPYGVVIVISQRCEPVGCDPAIWKTVSQRFGRIVLMRPGRHNCFVTFAFKVGTPFIPATVVYKGACDEHNCSWLVVFHISNDDSYRPIGVPFFYLIVNQLNI